MSYLCDSCLITGASRGIGLEFIKQISHLPKPPAHIFAACRNPESAKDLQDIAGEHPNVHIIKLDVSSNNEIKAAMKEVKSVVGKKGLNLLLNNAGILDFSQTLGNLNRKNMLNHYNINTVSPAIVAQIFLPLLKKAATANSSSSLGVSRAAIVNISTRAASIGENVPGADPVGYAYRASKAGLNMVTRCLSIDVKTDGIISVCLHPGFVSTDLTHHHKNAIDASASVNGMLNFLRDMGESNNGEFYTYEGKQYPW